MSTGTPDVVPDLSYFTLDELFEEIRKRGYKIDLDKPHGLQLPTIARVEAEGNQEPVEKWLEVWDYIETSGHQTRTWEDSSMLWHAVYRLYLLLEPPSVRAARTKGLSAPDA